MTSTGVPYEEISKLVVNWEDIINKPDSFIDWTVDQNDININANNIPVLPYATNQLASNGTSGLSNFNFNQTRKDKLASIESGAEVNVNSDWNATSGDAQILNKPLWIPTSDPGYLTGIPSDITDKLNGIQSGAEVNVNSDWNATSGDAQILNKPSWIPTSDPGYITGIPSDITDKLDSIEEGAEVNVNSDWNATSGDAEILNKPQTIGGVALSGTSVDLPGVNQTGNQDTTGNAATATKLQSARTLGGVSFDGTANIDLPGVNQTGNQDTTGNAATATRLQSARTIEISGDTTADATAFNGTANITLSSTLSNTGVSADTYGSTTTVPVITVDSKGRITAASNQAISQISSVNNFTVGDVGAPEVSGQLGGIDLTGGVLSYIRPDVYGIRAAVQTGSLTQLSVTGPLNLGQDNGESYINILFDDHSTGPGSDTAIFIGKTEDLPNGSTTYPTYMPGGAYGIQFQGNSDGAFYGIENYGNNQYRPIIKWGDDVVDTPFTIKSHNGTGGSSSSPHETQFRTNGDLVCMNGNVETNGYFKGTTNTVCKIHYISYTDGETSNASGNNFSNVVTKTFTKTVGTKLVIETNFEYSIDGYGSDSFESRIKMYYYDYNSASIPINSLSPIQGDEVELVFTGAHSGGGHRSNGLNDCVLISSASSTVNYSGTISCRLEIRRLNADDTVTVRQGYFKVTELWD